MAVNLYKKSKNENDEEERRQVLAQIQQDSLNRKNADIQAVKKVQNSLGYRYNAFVNNTAHNLVNLQRTATPIVQSTWNNIQNQANNFLNRTKTYFSNTKKAPEPMQAQNTSTWNKVQSVSQNAPIVQPSANMTVPTTKGMEEKRNEQVKQQQEKSKDFKETIRQNSHIATQEEIANTQVTSPEAYLKAQEYAKKAEKGDYSFLFEKAGDEIISGGQNALGGIVQGFAGLGQMATRALGADDATNALMNFSDEMLTKQNRSGETRQLLKQNLERAGKGGFLNDVLNVGGNLVESVSNTVISGAFGGGSGSTFGMGLSAGGNAFAKRQKESNGQNYARNVVASSLEGVWNSVWEKATGGNLLTRKTSINDAGEVIAENTGWLDKFALEKIAKYAKNPRTINAVNKVWQQLGEVVEEVGTDLFSAITNDIVAKENFKENFNWAQEKETAFYTVLSTLVLSKLGLGGMEAQDLANQYGLSLEQVQQVEKEVDSFVEEHNVKTDEKTVGKIIDGLMDKNGLDTKTLDIDNTLQEIYDENTQGKATPSPESEEYKTNIQSIINNIPIPDDVKAQIQPFLNSNATMNENQYNSLKDTLKKYVEADTQRQYDELKNNVSAQYDQIEAQIEQLDEIKPENFQDAESRKFYAQQVNADYDTTAMDSILAMYPENRNGKRTVKAYKEIARQYGQQMAQEGLNFDQVRANTVGAWQQYEPNKNITRYDNKEHKNQGFEKLNSQVWSQEVYDSYKETMTNQLNQQKQNIMNDYQTQFQEIEDNSKAIEMTIDNLKPRIEAVKSSLVQSAEQYGYKGKQISEIQDLMKRRGINAYFDETQFNNNSEGAFYNPKTNEIVFNPNASQDQVIQELAVHEWYHDLVAKGQGSEIQQSVIDFLKNNKDYQDLRKSLENAYAKLTDPNTGEYLYDIESKDFSDMIDEEATAKTLQRVLGNETEIQRLINYKPSLARRIYDAVVNLLNKFTGGRIEKLYWQDVRNKFESEFNKAGISTNEGTTRYSAKENRQYLEKQFEEMTGDSIDRAGLRLAGIEVRNGMREAGNLDGELEPIPYSKEAMDIYWKAQSSVKSSRFLYHSTPADRLQSIIENGLTIGNKQNQEGVSSLDKLYLASTPELAESFTDTNHILFRINPNAKLENLDYDLLGGEGAYTITNNIPPEMLQVKENGKWVGLKRSKLAKQINNNVPTTNSDIRYNIQLSDEVDNDGNKLSNGQVEYFANSKARDSDGQLEVVYHTTTDDTTQFNEFNPTGTSYYRFGDQVVNYYTNSKEMSGSYASQNYNVADTQKLNSIEDVNNFLKSINQNNTNQYSLTKVSGIDYVIETSEIGSKALEFLNSLSDDEIKQLKNNIHTEKMFKGTPLERTFEWDNFDKNLQEKYKKITDEFVGTNQLVDLQKRMIEHLENYSESKTYGGKLIGAYDTDQEMYRNLKQDIQKADWTKNGKIQYQGYVNITNPYIIDAKGKNWDKVSSKVAKEIESDISEIKENEDLMNRLKELAKKSKEKHTQYIVNYENQDFQNYSLSDGLRTDLQRDASKEFKDTLNDCIMFGFSYDDYSNMYRKEGISLPSGDTKIYDLMHQYYEKHDPNDISSRFDKGYAFGNMTLNEFVKEANRLYEADLNYGREDSWFERNLSKTFGDLNVSDYISNNINDKKITSGQLYRIAKFGFSDEAITEILGENETTNDIVKQVIEMNKKGTNYDGIIMKNVVDYGGYSKTHEPADLFVTFSSEQFKAKDNRNPTMDKDIRYSEDTNFDDWANNNLPSLGEGKTTLGELRTEQPKLPVKQPKNTQPIPPTTNVQPTAETKETNLPISQETTSVPLNNQKQRRAYKSIIESEMMSDEAKAIAKKFIGQDTYTPDSNAKQLSRADDRIQRNGVEKELDTLETNAMEGKTIKADDIAVGDRLIQYYSKVGDSENLQRAIRATAMAGTQAGRSVQAFALLRHQTPEGMAIWIQNSVDKLNSKTKNGQFDFTQEMQEKILNSTEDNLQQNVDEVMKELGQQVPKDILSKLDAWRYFSMLANPKTHIRNIVGNFAMGLTQRVSNKVAGTIEQVTGRDRTKTSIFERRSKANIEFAKNDLKNVSSQLGMGTSKYSNPQNAIQQNQRTFKSDALEKSLGRMFNLNDNLLEAEDNFGLKNAYVRNLSDYMSANKLNPDTLTNEQLQKARAIAIDKALEATFHQASNLASVLNQLENKNIGTRLILGGLVPFKKTPINVAKAGAEYSPAGLAKSLVYDTVQLRKGNINTNQWIDNISKGLTGTGIAVLGYALAKAGILKAGGDDDKEDKYKQAMGEQPYAITINGKSYSLDWLAPSGIPLFVGAELAKIVDDKTEKDGETENEVLKAMGRMADATSSLLNPMSEMSMISGITSTIQSFSQDSGQALMNLVVSPLKSYVGQTVPTALGQVARTMDTYERDTSSTEKGLLPKAIDQTKNQIMNKIPGLRQMLPTKKDIWGEEVETQDYFHNAVLPWTEKEIKSNPVDTELNSLYEKTGESIYPNTSLAKEVTYDGSKTRLTNQDYNEFKESYGKNSYRILNNLINSNEYKSLSDEQKVKAIKDVYTYANNLNKYNYAQKKGIAFETPTDVQAVNAIKQNGGTEVDYFKYKDLTDGMNNNSEKISAIKDSNLSSRSKKALYNATVGKNDKFYQNTDIDINEYLGYKASGVSKKADTLEYVNQNISGYENRLLIMAKDFKLTRSQQRDLANYINTLSNADDIYSMLSNNFTMTEDGKVYYK